MLNQTAPEADRGYGKAYGVTFKGSFLFSG